ncbi:C45 family autoproteolytic acyltransferase/hydolase [uncultured Aquimarina sp.]|uniref:C45 family autoproteolytic acyltransferase/hydolase n=1 Tax=uncultured Aquimarina sp. TaxID=575652 RepID=UPI002610AEBF|nr:C45 family autoproteolytic acyltransferase/hydolase [uncultured Aquimarina sp.]
MKECIVNLDLPPEKRWVFLKTYKKEVNELLRYYINDFVEADILFDSVNEYKEQLVSEEYLKEIDGIATICDFSPDQILIANLYYDLLKFYLGCTAFAVYNGTEILHSRNLDWHTKNDLLSKYSRVFDFQKNGKTVFKSIGWPGFIGVLSGTKPGKFSSTLNAVSSNDSPEIAAPISFLLRDILCSCNTFEEAKNKIEHTVIMSDCLILLSGIKKEDKAVIERTPKRFATRTTEEDYIIVTNDYKLLQNSSSTGNMLQDTSCGRYNNTQELLLKKIPLNDRECLKILQDDNIMMGITVQQMVFHNHSGNIKLIKPVSLLGNKIQFRITLYLSVYNHRLIGIK